MIDLQSKARRRNLKETKKHRSSDHDRLDGGGAVMGRGGNVERWKKGMGKGMERGNDEE